MKIGIDCRLWNESGVGRYTRNLVSELSKIDIENNYVLFALSKDVSSIKYQVLSRSWKIVVADIRWHTLKEQLKLPSIINKEKLDLMHFPYFSVPVFYKKPFIVTIHDLIINHFLTGKASTLPAFLYDLKLLGYKYVISHAVKNAKKIITVSNATKQEIVDHLKISPGEIVVTYEGVDSTLNSKSEAQNPKQSQNTKYLIHNTKYFLYVGNAYPHKNLERLIQAFEILASSKPDARLILVGKEDYFYKKLKKKVQKMNVHKNISFYGEVSDDELNSLYKSAKAVIVPSLMEGFGLPALEAMANGCLVLASKIPALQEVCSDAAIYFDSYNVKDIAGKMSEVLSNDSYHYNDKRKRGLERVKLFSWEKMAKETLRVYNSL